MKTMKCLISDCNSEGDYSRGLCRRCYRRISKRVRRGTTTWQDFIDKGFAQKSKNHGASTKKRREAAIKANDSKIFDVVDDLKKLQKASKKILDRGYITKLGDFEKFPDIVEKHKKWANGEF